MFMSEIGFTNTLENKMHLKSSNQESKQFNKALFNYKGKKDISIRNRVILFCEKATH